MEKEKQEKKVVDTTKKFVSLKDLTKEDLGSFVKLPVVFSRTKTKKGNVISTIKVNVDSTFLSEVNIRPNGNSLTNDKFNLILLENDFPIKNPRGYELTKWNYNVNCRFVKGQYTKSDGEYYSLELLFKKGFYMTHFFDYDQIDIIKGLIEKNLFKYEFIERPDSIDKKESTDDLDF